LVVFCYAGPTAPGRSSDLFGTKGATGILKSLTGGLKGVENIYTQHAPLVAQVENRTNVLFFYVLMAVR
jgi:hypothetical protein